MNKYHSTYHMIHVNRIIIGISHIIKQQTAVNITPFIKLQISKFLVIITYKHSTAVLQDRGLGVVELDSIVT